MTKRVNHQVCSFHCWNQAVGVIIDNLHATSLPSDLSAALRKIVPIDVVLIEILYRNDVPTMIYDDVSQERHKVVIGNYLTGPYLLDPFYQAYMEDIEPGGYRLEELAPDDFINSEYYQQYYRAVDCGDEFGFLFPLTSDAGACISVSRFAWNPKFSTEELDALKAVEPVIRASFSSYWKERKSTSATDLSSASGMHQQITSAVANFGKSALTNRECQIVQLVLRGHSSKSIAEKLHISAATVNTHRHKIYEKLDVTSQAELFSLFIGALSCCSDNSDFVDPLEAYHKRNQ